MYRELRACCWAFRGGHPKTGLGSSARLSQATIALFQLEQCRDERVLFIPLEWLPCVTLDSHWLHCCGSQVT